MVAPTPPRASPDRASLGGVTADESLGGSYLRPKSQHRRNRGDDMQQATHLAGLVQLYRVAKREVAARTPRGVRSPIRDERRQLVDRTINLGAAGSAFLQENCHRAGSAPRTRDWCERLIKRGPCTTKIVEDPELDSVSRHMRSCAAHVDHQKDVIGLVFSQRLGRQARQKQIDSAQTRKGRSGRGFRRNQQSRRLSKSLSQAVVQCALCRPSAVGDKHHRHQPFHHIQPCIE
jgi:hypothetical protein